jgi:hypothetical protein
MNDFNSQQLNWISAVIVYILLNIVMNSLTVDAVLNEQYQKNIKI